MDYSILKTKAESYGASLFGVSKLDKNYLGYGYAITVAVKLPDSVLKTIEGRPTISYFHAYRTANALLDRICLLLSLDIEELGYEAFPIGASQSDPSSVNYEGLFSHKMGARLAGLGFIGKNGLFISKKYGSKVRLATILTNMPLTQSNAPLNIDCGNCDLCVKACPAGAIYGVNFKDGLNRDDLLSAEKCSNNMKTYKDVGRGAVCGICIKVCPHNKLK